MPIMKPFSRYILVFLILMTRGAYAQTEVDARKLVRQTLEDLYSYKVAKVWESFSDTSKDNYRRVFLDFVKATDKFVEPEVTPKNESKWVTMRKEEERKYQGGDRDKYTTAEHYLRRVGFIDGLEKVRVLDNEEFWDVFLGGKYLEDKKNQDFSRKSTVLYPKHKPEVPPYQIDGVAASGDKFFVVMRAPYTVRNNLFASLDINGDWGWNIGPNAWDQEPQVSFVWSGVKENGKIKLNVPDSVINRLAIATYSMTKDTHRGKNADAESGPRE
jgi:hypothetical protein